MRKTVFFVVMSVALSALCTVTVAQTAPREGVFQYSTIDALLAGAYDGDMTVEQLERHGNFGIGTYNRVDGEMIVVDGVAYQVKATGAIAKVGPELKTPFAVITDFKPQRVINASSSTGLKSLEERLDAEISNKNLFYAIRVEGNFTTMRTRAIPPQDKPYKPLAEASKSQTVFNFANVHGTLIGFRSPSFSKGFNVPGYHWHFLGDDLKSGGHVLDLTMEKGVIKVMQADAVEIQVPVTDQFATSNLSIDRTNDLKSVEGARKN